MVYVCWYGKVVAGNVVNENDLMGMTAVKIPVQGIMATALFMPGHVYQTAEEAGKETQRETAGNGGGCVEKVREIAESVPKIEEIAQKDAESVPNYAENVPKLSPLEYVANVYVNDLVERFKEENWDTERNHLRTDKLDEFYQLWRKTHSHLEVEAKPDEEEAGTVAEKPEVVKVEVVPQNGTASKPQRVKKQKPIKATQLSLFD